MGIKSDDAMKMILVSYVPLLVTEPGRSDFDPNEVSSVLDEAPGLAAACVWLQNEGQLSSCLVIKKAEEIAEHLKAWAENEPEKWFRLCISEHEGLYGLALMPDLKKCIERFRMAYQLRNGLPLPEKMQVTALFKPLHFSSKPGHTYGQVKGKLSEKVKVYVIESDLVSRENPQTSPWEKATLLGEFELVRSGPECDYVKQILEH